MNSSALPAGGQTAGGILPRRFHQAVEPLAGCGGKREWFHGCPPDSCRTEAAEKARRLWRLHRPGAVFRHIARRYFRCSCSSASIPTWWSFCIFAPSVGRNTRFSVWAEGSFQTRAFSTECGWSPSTLCITSLGHGNTRRHSPSENVAVRGAALPAELPNVR